LVPPDFSQDFFFLAHLVSAKDTTSNTGASMIHPKDVGLAFPRNIKGKKAPSPLRSKPKKYKKASESEEMLQNKAEEACIKRNLDYDHTPQIVYEWLLSGSEYCPPEIISYIKKLLWGRPDLELIKKIEGTDFMLLGLLELKTDSPQSKLRATQKRFLKGKNFGIARDKAEITQFVEDFNNFEVEL